MVGGWRMTGLKPSIVSDMPAPMTHGERTKARIVSTGLQLWPNVSARRIARQLGLTHTAVLYHYGTSAALRDAVALHAVAVGDRSIVPQLIASRHAAAADLTAAQRADFLAGC